MGQARVKRFGYPSFNDLAPVTAVTYRAPMDYANLLYERHGPVTVITIDRPERTELRGAEP
jgi:hypothetical protein